jgi:hypothetical protein
MEKEGEEWAEKGKLKGNMQEDWKTKLYRAT